MVHIAAVINGWKPATLQLFEEGSSCFVDHLSIAASERNKFFRQFKSQEQISNLRSIHQRLFSFLSNVKRIFNNNQLKEPIKESFLQFIQIYTSLSRISLKRNLTKIA